MTKYYADLNPDFPSQYEKRWAVFYRFCPDSETRRAQPRYSLQFVTRKAAERHATILNAMEAEGE